MHPSTNSVVLKEHSCNKKREKASEVYTKCHKVERSSERGQTRRKKAADGLEVHNGKEQNKHGESYSGSLLSPHVLPLNPSKWSFLMTWPTCTIL